MDSPNPIDRVEHDALRHLIATWRTDAGLSQRELSERMRRAHNFVTKVETGVRRLYVVDLIDIIRAVGKDIPSAFAEYCHLIDD